MGRHAPTYKKALDHSKARRKVYKSGSQHRHEGGGEDRVLAKPSGNPSYTATFQKTSREQEQSLSLTEGQ